MAAQLMASESDATKVALGSAAAIGTCQGDAEIAVVPPLQGLLAATASTSSRPPSPRLGGNSLSAMTARTRASSTSGSRVAIKPLGSDGALMSMMRKQMEDVEAKLTAQISRVQQQSDRLHDAALSRTDARMGTMEVLQPKMDRRLAELGGNCKGLSEEMQAQIRRIDQMDTRLWDWRKELEEEMRNKFSELEQAHQQISSAARMSMASSEEGLKRCNRRLGRLESLFDERQVAAQAANEDVNQSLVNLHARLSEVEDQRSQDSDILKTGELVLSSTPAVSTAEQLQAAGDHCAIMALESRAADAAMKLDKLEQWQQESHIVHTRLEEQEERLRSLRTLMETKDEHYRWLSDRVERTDWEGRFKELQSQVQELEQSRVDYIERLKLTQQKQDLQEEAHEAFGDQLRRLQERGYSLPDDLGAYVAMGAQDGELPHQVSECLIRIGESEERINALYSEISGLKAEDPVGKGVGQLVQSLKQVAPKIMEHEAVLKEMREKVGALEVEGKMDHKNLQKALDGVRQSESMAARISRLEVIASHIEEEVDAQLAEVSFGSTESQENGVAELENDVKGEPITQRRRASFTE